MKATLMAGDCRERLRELADASIDAVVSDPPYGLSFMNRAWDYDVPSAEIWREVCRVLKPGGHLVAFFGSRTYHRGTVAIEDAGFEIRDQLMWLYGSGFPKSLDVSKAIDKAAGAEREVIGQYTVGGTAAKGKRRGRAAAAADEGSAVGCTQILNITAPATNSAKQWAGWGTALKPAHEPICLARKPFSRTVAANVLEHGTGAINVDGCRVGDTKRVPGSPKTVKASEHTVSLPGYAGGSGHDPNIGRWPANVLHDGSDEVVDRFPSDASRFFYTPKADAEDRNDGIPPKLRNRHPTVKPVDLMRWLVRLITPPGGVVLDPFMGSGSTGKACALEGRDFVGVELDPDYVSVAEARIAHAGGLFGSVVVR
jgi:site-specific DNA-methyltransferase (adenine-specific)